MLPRRALLVSRSQCRAYVTTHGLQPVPILPDATVETFRKEAFEAATPALLPRQSFQDLPAVHKWFSKEPTKAGSISLNRPYLSRFGSTIVPLEISDNDQFTRVEQPLSFFLECVNAASSTFCKRPNRYFSSYVPGARAIRRTTESNDFFSASTTTVPTARVYLAQAPIQDLPRGLRDDVSTPDIVLKAGKGDVYDSSIWLGQAPTYTPLHRDPNPNLFVHLAGKKLVRLYKPDVGRAIFAKVQERIGGSASATMRGEEMMQGVEKKALEAEVWNDDAEFQRYAWQAVLENGDAMFIPKGWWHSIKGVGAGMTGSVNWWFR